MFQALAASMLISCDEGLPGPRTKHAPDVPENGMDRPCLLIPG
jgi:hypothetical protein